MRQYNYINSEGSLLLPFNFVRRVKFINLDKNSSILWGIKKELEYGSVYKFKNKFFIKNIK